MEANPDQSSAEPNAVYEHELTWAFELDPHNLERLHSLLHDFSASEVTFGITTSDHYVQSMTLQELLQYENTAQRRVEGVLAMTSGPNGDEVSVSWMCSTADDNIEIKIEGERHKVEKLRQDLLALREAVRPLHGWITERAWAWAVVGLLVFIGCTIVAGSWLEGDWPVLVGLLSLVAVWLTRNTMFPIGVLLVGAGARRAERAKWLRVVVLGPLLLGLLGSAAWSLIAGPTSS